MKILPIHRAIPTHFPCPALTPSATYEILATTFRKSRAPRRKEHFFRRKSLFTYRKELFATRKRFFTPRKELFDLESNIRSPGRKSTALRSRASRHGSRARRLGSCTRRQPSHPRRLPTRFERLPNQPRLVPTSLTSGISRARRMPTSLFIWEHRPYNPKILHVLHPDSRRSLHPRSVCRRRCRGHVFLGSDSPRRFFGGSWQALVRVTG